MAAIRILAALALVLLAGAIPARAADETAASPVAAPAAGESAPEASADVRNDRILIASAFSSGNVGGNVPAGAQPVDSPVHLRCPKKPKGRCLYEAEMMLQITNSQAANAHAVCAHLDGNVMTNPLCPNHGAAPTSGFSFLNVTQYAANVRKGDHTLQTFVNSTYGITPYTYSIVYRVYKLKN